MRTKHSLYIPVIFFIVSLCSLVCTADPALNGVAAHAELGKEDYIGALYSTQLSNSSDVLINSTQAMRMELKIVTPDGITTRRFSRMWIDGMGINNTSALLTEQADNMVKFDGLFKGRLMQNDIVVFTFEPNKGVNVLVNDVLLGNIPSDKFFAMLLRSWIGKVPLSSDYKDGILKSGNVSADLKARFEKIKPTKERSIEVASWGKVKTAAELAAEAASKVTSSQASSESTKTTKVDIAKAEAAKAEAAKLAAQKAEEEKPALTAKTLLARQFYVTNSINKIRTVVRYPKRSLERAQKGNVRVAIVVDRKGNVISTSLLEESKFELLNEAAVSAVTQSAPFPPIPDEIPGAAFEFNVPIIFAFKE